MKKLEFQLPMFIMTVENHAQIKNELLQKIDETPQGRIQEKGQVVTKSDWYIPGDVYRPYIDIVYPYFNDFIAKITKEFYKDQFLLQIVNYWFQQYEVGDFHDWHRHSGCFSFVYYVELPTNSSLTTFYIQNEEVSIPVEEGQIIAFLSGIEHQSKPNLVGRKTVIAFNAM